jgi:hypothetical protein
VDGKPLRVTLAGVVQVGCIGPTTEGAVGALGTGFIVTVKELNDVQPSAFITENVYTPVAKPEIVRLVPVPVVVTLSGLRINVHEPVAGKPLRMTLPVGVLHVGCVIVPIKGAVAGVGVGKIVKLVEAGDVQPKSLVTV